MTAAIEITACDQAQDSVAKGAALALGQPARAEPARDLSLQAWDHEAPPLLVACRANLQSLIRHDRRFLHMPVSTADWPRALDGIVSCTGENDELAKELACEVRDLHSEAAVFLAWADPGASQLLAAERALLELSSQTDSRPAPPWRMRVQTAAKILRAARRIPSVDRRVFALYLAHRVVSHEPPAPLCQQYDAERLSATERARAAHERMDQTPPALAGAYMLPANVLADRYRAALVETAAGVPSPQKAHASDPQAMFLASPFAPQGRSDDRSKTILNKEAERMKSPAPASAGLSSSPGAAGSSRAIRGDRMVQMHLQYGQDCEHCKAGDCAIFHVAALATAGPVAWYPGQRPRADRTAHARTYPLPQDEELFQSEAVRKLLESGRANPVAAAPFVSPTFVVTKFSYAESAAWAAAELALPGASDRMEDRIATAMAAMSLQARSATPADASRALAHGVTVASRRLVFDYSPTVNKAGVPWPMAMCHASEMIAEIRPGTWAASVDVEEGFHKISMAQEDRAYLAFSDAQGTLASPSRLMFGMRQGPAHFSTVSAEMARTAERIIRQSLSSQSGRSSDSESGPICDIIVRVYIDDFFILNASSEDEGTQALILLEAYGDHIGAPFKRSKRRPPSQCFPLLGMMVDTVSLMVMASADKQYNCLYMVTFFIRLAAKGFPLPASILRKLVGKLQNLTAVWPRGTAHMAPLYIACDETSGAAVATAAVPAALGSLRYWRGALAAQRPGSLCVPMPSSPHASPWVETYSDASADGAGGGFALQTGPLMLWGRWNLSEMGPRASIGRFEMYPKLLLNELYGDMLDRLRWRAHTDNLPNAFALLRGTTDDRQCRPLLSALLMSRRELTVGTWTPRDFNQFSDDGSKALTVKEACEVMANYYFV